MWIAHLIVKTANGASYRVNKMVESPKLMEIARKQYRDEAIDFKTYASRELLKDIELQLQELEYIRGEHETVKSSTIDAAYVKFEEG